MKYTSKLILNWEEYYFAAPEQWWQPWANTIFYYDFENNTNDSSWNNHNITVFSWMWYETVWWQEVAKVTNASWYIQIDPSWTSWIGSWDFAISFWFYPVTVPWWGTWRYPMLFWIYDANSPYGWPTIFFDPNDRNGHWDCIYFRMRGNGSSYEHPSTTTASSLYNGWHHVVMTRNSGNVSCYIDNVLETSWSWDTISFPTSSYSAYLFSRWDYADQTRWTTWAKADKYIFESKARTVQEISDYYNQTKSLYGIS